MRKANKFFQVLSSLFEVTIEHCTSNHTNFDICGYWDTDVHHNALIYAEMTHRAFPEPIRKIRQFRFRIQYGILTNNSQYLEDNPSSATRFELIISMHKRRLL